MDNYTIKNKKDIHRYTDCFLSYLIISLKRVHTHAHTAYMHNHIHTLTLSFLIPKVPFLLYSPVLSFFID